MNRQGQPPNSLSAAPQRPPNLPAPPNASSQTPNPLNSNTNAAAAFRAGQYSYGIPQRGGAAGPNGPSLGSSSGILPGQFAGLGAGAGVQRPPQAGQNVFQQRPGATFGLSGSSLPQSQSQSQSQSSDISLDLNDFPALGAPSANTTSSNTNASSTANNVVSTPGASYASQAGTGLPSLSGPGAGGGGGTIGRDFTPDDFPALGGSSASSQNQSQSQQSANSSSSTTDSHSHGPPGLNGFEQHRQSLLGTLNAVHHQQQPGMINLAGHPGFGDDKRRTSYTIKPNAASAWSQHHTPNAQTPSNAVNGNGNGGTESSTGDPSPPSNPSNHSQNTNPNSSAPTPAHQILVSPADKWGLLGLIALIKSATTLPNGEVDGRTLTSLGTDLSTMGLDLAYTGTLYNSFVTPWSDSSSSLSLASLNGGSEPGGWSIPSCYYDVRAPIPGPSKLEAFSDETLFFVFYAHPRDALQEMAAQELYNRMWRYHKNLRVWISKEGAQVIKHLPASSLSSHSHSLNSINSVGEVGYYTYWDVQSWTRERKEMTILYAELEERAGPPVFPPAQTLEQSKGILQAQVQAQQAQQVVQAQAQQGRYQMPAI